MKNIMALLFIIIAFVSCKKDITSTAPLQEMADTSAAAIKFDASFMNGPYGSATGGVKIYQDSSGLYQLSLINVMISNGPDLHVYLSQEVQPINFIDLGKLKSTSGSQAYPIIVVPDFSKHKYVLIHCQKYNHLFGSAALK
jgi:Electron transfer DM13